MASALHVRRCRHKRGWSLCDWAWPVLPRIVAHMAHRPKLLARVLRELGRSVKGSRSWGPAVQGAWRAAPVPWTPHFHEVDLGHGVTAVEMSRMLMGHQWMTVRTFVVEHGVDSALPGTLVDAGLACMAPRLAELASTRGIKRCVVTHHHEDHCGGAAAPD